jgi:predicted RNA-binding protein YlxR (DUF448 family)
MCIGCRKRLAQRELVRLSCIDGEVQKYIGIGRSFYLCKKCIENGEKILKRALSKACKKEIKINNLEKILNG